MGGKRVGKGLERVEIGDGKAVVKFIRNGVPPPVSGVPPPEIAVPPPKVVAYSTPLVTLARFKEAYF